MDIELTISVLNQLVADKVVEKYALGGAIAAIFYIEPFDTQDVDVFVQIRAEVNDLMVLSPVYNYLQSRGYQAKAEHIYIEGFPVQFLPTFDGLTEEAVELANEFQLDTVSTRIMTPEHLVAIMLNTGRLKDYLRINLFLQANVIDKTKLQNILERHDLILKWSQNTYRFE